MAPEDSPFATSILITGGAGFLGRGILRYIERNQIPANVTVYSRDEAKHYALRSKFPKVRTVLGDICDTDRLQSVMAGHELVIHAAALKHIPEAERDVAEAVRINVDGSRSVAKAAIAARVDKVVGISTDKVCSPRNTYGATKMLMERIFQEADNLAGETDFNCVRYGNVISSTGSVVPLFTDQLKRDGFFSITSNEMTRFWLSIDDAVRLIEHSIGWGHGGGVTTLRCPAMGILDVAAAVALYKKEGGVTWNGGHKVIGLRPGEKLHETLVDEAEAPFGFESEGYINIPPAIMQRGETTPTELGGFSGAYSSDAPARWMSVNEFVELIRDAEAI